jgi:hypothetical protein
MLPLQNRLEPQFLQERPLCGLWENGLERYCAGLARSLFAMTDYAVYFDGDISLISIFLKITESRPLTCRAIRPFLLNAESGST